MVKRLTEYFECGAYTTKENIIDVSDKVKFFENGCLMGKAIDKLAQLEDIMEKYNIKTVEELDKRLEDVEQYNYETNRQFIDVMAKYGIEDTNELEDKIICYEANKDVNLGLKIDIKNLEKELNIWQKACELACEEIDCECMYGINKENYSQYFYQQAKTEGNDEND